MNEVQFQESKINSPLYQPEKSNFSFVSLLVKYSGGKINENQASIILIVFFVVSIIVSIFLFLSRGEGKIDEKYYFDPSTQTEDDAEFDY